ncbi:MAG TPA: copper resistance protein CopC [Nitrospiria bacterium]|nr:copper resistance protein CopC [Nitrospiria bacterium]
MQGRFISSGLKQGSLIEYPKKISGVLLVLFLSIPVSAGAHAFPDHSDPRVGSTQKIPPANVRIWFDGPIEPLFSTLEVFDSSGQKVDKGDSQVDPGDHTILEVGLPTLPPGTYTVSWSVIAIDTHHTEGRFKFSIEGKS